MARTFRIFRPREGGHVAVKAGFSWPGFFLWWLWPLAKRVWLPGAVLTGVTLVLAWFGRGLAAEQPLFFALAAVVLALTAGLRLNDWIAARREARGDMLIGDVAAPSSVAAIAIVARAGGQVPAEARPRPESAGLFSWPPRTVQALLAVAGLTVRAAFRSRLVVVLTALLLGSVVALPLVIKHDDTAQGFTQILLTYTLGITTALLSFVTLWLACGTLARDVDECQMQVVAVKPVPRWQVWLGKWLGVLALNALLLGVAAGSVYLLMLWRARQLPPEEQFALRHEVLTARGAARERPPDLDARVDEILRERGTEFGTAQLDPVELRRQLREVVKAREQLVQPGYARRYVLDLRRARDQLATTPAYARLKFFTPELAPRGLYDLEILVGPPDGQRRAIHKRLTAENFHEFELGQVTLDPEGRLIVDVANRSPGPLVFPLDDGFEVLYRQGGFGANFLRAVAIILCWLALLGAVGLTAGSFLSFPVAAFVATGVLLVGLSGGTLKTVVEDNTLLGVDHETGRATNPGLDAVAVPVFRALHEVLHLVQEFEPIDAVSSGRSIGWGTLARAVAQVVLLMGGLLAAIGIAAFSRRELATAPSHH